MHKRQILMNAVMSVLQVIILGGLLFVLYRYLLNSIGVEKLGIWSVVLATTSVANVANLGLSASVVKFVAKYLARGDKEIVARLIQTAAISICIFIGIGLWMIFPFSKWLLGFVIPAVHIDEAFSILPYAFLSLWLTVIASVFQAGLDGYQRIDLRSILVIASSSSFLAFCYLIVPTYGLIGLAYAQVLQAIIILIGGWFMLKRLLLNLPVVPYKWDSKLFKEIVGYGLSFQVISISQMLYDPVTKTLLTKFGGLSVTGFYEMASRLIIQLRAILISANQVLVPAIADLQEKKADNLQDIYKKNYNLILYIALPFFSGIIAVTPLISKIWIGHHEDFFIFSLILLSCGWFINTLNAPSYFTYLGTGELFWNTVSHIVMAVLNFVVGLALGSVYGAEGVIIAWVFSLIIGSMMIILSYHTKNNHHVSIIFPKEVMNIGLACVFGILFSRLLYSQLGDHFNMLISTVIVLFVFIGIVIVPLWVHPMRKQLIGWINAELVNRQGMN